MLWKMPNQTEFLPLDLPTFPPRDSTLLSGELEG